MIGTGGLRVLGMEIFRSRYLTGIVPPTTAAGVRRSGFHARLLSIAAVTTAIGYIGSDIKHQA
jgi:hypothetical protein